MTGRGPGEKGVGSMVKRLAMLAFVFALAATACTGDDNGDGDGDGNGDGAVAQRDFRFVVVTHGQASDPFWSVAANGVEAAAEDMGVEVEYQAPGTFDMVEMSQLIDAAVASQPDGLVVSLPDADALGPSITAAVDAGIPVITMNSGSDTFADLGVLLHVGQTEFEAGLIAGQRFAEEGVENPICLNQEVGNAALDLRCEGFFEGLGVEGEVIAVDLDDPTGTTETVAGALQNNPDIDGILTLGPTGAAADARGARGGRHARGDRVRDLRPLAGGPRGDRRGRHAVRDRPGPVPAGVPADRVPHEVPGDRRVAARERGSCAPDRTTDRDGGDGAGRR